MESPREDPIAKQIADELKKLDGRAVAKRFTVHGEVIVLQVDGKYVDVPFEADQLDPLPAKFGAKHRDVMEIIYSAVTQIAENKNRTVPLTRNELTKEFGAEIKIVKDLERFGLIRTRLIKLVPAKTPRATKGESRAICYFTPQGRAYVRAEFDPSYGAAEPSALPTIDGAAPGSDGPAQGHGQPVQ